MRILAFDWFTSTHPYAQVIHSIDHDRTQIIRGHSLILVVEARCGAKMSPKTLALLSNQDASSWMLGYGELPSKYGPRKQCRWC